MDELAKIEFLQKELKDLQMGLETQVNPNMGSAAISIPIKVSDGRNGFAPQFSLNYASGSGNSTYGMGWNLSGLSTISIDTKNGFPGYNQEDKFTLDGSQLVPYMKQGKKWTYVKDEYTIHYFRNRWEQSFQRVEFWDSGNASESFWVVRNPDGSVSVYGKNEASKIFDPAKMERTFSWLLQEQYDQKGNVIVYEYKIENAEGVDQSLLYEYNRFKARNPISQRYLKRVLYGNDKAVEFGDNLMDLNFHFKIVLDYGEHSDAPENSFDELNEWPVRKDPFSAFVTGFEIRTWRLCKRFLKFHHFKDQIGENVLVGETKLQYLPDASGTILKNIAYSGYKKLGSEYWKESIPHVSFEYQEASVGTSFVQSLKDSALENIPYGLGEVNYKMSDVYGEGVPGILFETDKAWYYKSNLGEGNFGKLHQIAEKPASHTGDFAMTDFDNNGNPNLVALQGSKAGYYEYDRDRKQWSNFQNFIDAPSIEHGAQLMDINGDGKAELVIFKQDRITYYPSKGKEGFAAPVEVYRPLDNGISHLPTLGDNLMLDYFTADMTGDGIPDQVRILNGKVEYWSHLGHGRYTEGTVMANAPILEEGFEFDAARIRLVDLSGSGTSDLLYIGRGEIRYWLNQSGNTFSEGKSIGGLPYIENFASLQIADFLGNGTSCLIWSSALPNNAHAPIQYLPLVGAKPPGLLIKAKNGMGMETHFEYEYSAIHYLRDKQNNSPWITHLPSHSYVVKKQIIKDTITGTTLSSEYKYHDGFYDGKEREFRGFGFVEQYDLETIKETAINLDMNTAEKACIKTWFHNGSYSWKDKRKQQFYKEGKTAYELPDHVIENLYPLDAKSFADSIRSLSGQILRTEVYGHDEQDRILEHPFQIQQHNFVVKEIQESTARHYGSYLALPYEELSCIHEKEADNPLVNHSIALQYNSYGIPEKQIVIGYPNQNAPTVINDQPNPQKRLLIQYIEQDFHHFNTSDRYEPGIPLASKSFEIDSSLFQNNEPIFSADVFRDRSFTDQLTHANLRIWEKSFYSLPETTTALAFGEIGNVTLLHHLEKMVGHKEDFENIFGSKVRNTDIGTVADLMTEGKYRLNADFYWQESENVVYNGKDKFYFPQKIIDTVALQGTTVLEFDPYHILLQNSTDRYGFRSSSEIDYYTLAPYRIKDINENTSEVIYDPLGMIRVSTMYGEIILAGAGTQPYGNEPLEIFDTQILKEPTLQIYVENPSLAIQKAGNIYNYDLGSTPVSEIQIVREQFIHTGNGIENASSPLQIGVQYYDGFGRVHQSKQKVEAGEAIKIVNGQPVFDSGNPVMEYTYNRWLVSGHIVYDKKQQPIKQFEPFFYPSFAFTNAELLQQFGYSIETRYDALGRIMRTEYPNNTFEKTIYTAWYTKQYDAIDTLTENSLIDVLTTDEHERVALIQAKIHAHTPTITYVDALGREVMIEVYAVNENNPRHPDNRISITEFDFYGNPAKIIDPRKIVAFEYLYDRAGRLLYEKSADAGEKWMFSNAADLLMHFWDGRGLHQISEYDEYNRLVAVTADGLEGYNQKTMEVLVYGDNHVLQNANGLVIDHYDQVGKQQFTFYDPGGTPLQTERQLTKDYKTEPNWKTLDIGLLEDETFTATIQVDALGRPIQKKLADGTKRMYAYHLSGGLQSLKVSTSDGRWQEQEILSNSEYNAKGQQVVVRYGNGVHNKYHYDPRSFQLKYLRTTRKISNTPDTLQELQYSYDPVGNITRIENIRPHVANGPIDFIKEYTYDAFYQLSEVKGVMHGALFEPNPGSTNQKDHLRLSKGKTASLY